MKYEVKYIINGKGYKQTVEASSVVLAKQKVLDSINIVSCEVVKGVNSNPFSGNSELDAIFGAFGKTFKK